MSYKNTVVYVGYMILCRLILCWCTLRNQYLHVCNVTTSSTVHVNVIIGLAISVASGQLDAQCTTSSLVSILQSAVDETLVTVKMYMYQCVIHI